MGDLVGYGPDPGACLDTLREHDFHAVTGNHDAAACGNLGVEAFNHDAAWAARWTTKQLSAEQLDFLRSLPMMREEGPFTLVHGSLRSPIWEYLTFTEAASATLELLPTQFCLVGHSHLPFICREQEEGPAFAAFPEDEPVAMGSERWIINPGGVGQPRDGDPRSSYGMYDSGEGTLTRRRVNYDIAKTQRKMEKAGLPPRLASRLSQGH